MNPQPFSSSFAGAGERRKPVRLTEDSLVRMAPLADGVAIPMVVRPALPQVSLLDWAKANRAQIDAQLLQHGAVLFRGFGVNSLEMFQSFAEAAADRGLAEYKYGSTPRRRIQGGIYTSTEYPADQAIPMHNEMSYSRAWPTRIWFCCLQAAAQGGATPIADSAAVFEAISPAVRERFIERGVMYVRNYGRGLDLSSEQVFGTTDRDEIARFCAEARIEYEVKADGTMRTRQICQAVAAHPQSGRMLWFNQAHLFHISGVEPSLAKELLAELGEAGLPRNAFYGDGTPIEPAALADIREAYRRTAITFAWEAGDVLMLDNMSIAHGREPYSGERRIAVAMAEPFSPDGLAEPPAWLPPGFIR